MKFNFLSIAPQFVDLRPNLPTRDWMDQTNEKFAYRCLPLNVANAHGWSFHVLQDFVVHWSGVDATEAITFKSSENIDYTVQSIFGNGIITFHTHGIFQTEPGWNLMASGAPNSFKDGIAPLTGVIETDWSPYSFTMNWKITRPNHWISFKKGDVFCSVFPVQRNILQDVQPEMFHISNDPELKEEHDKWSEARSRFNADLKIPGSDAEKEKWQKSYYRGQRPDGTKSIDDHIIKLRLNEFKDRLDD